MNPSDMHEMLHRFGVHNHQWREHVVVCVANEIGAAQIKAGFIGFGIGVCVALLFFLIERGV